MTTNDLADDFAAKLRFCLDAGESLDEAVSDHPDHPLATMAMTLLAFGWPNGDSIGWTDDHLTSELALAAYDWQVNWSFEPKEAADWLEAGVTDPEDAADYDAAGLGPSDVIPGVEPENMKMARELARASAPIEVCKVMGWLP